MTLSGFAGIDAVRSLRRIGLALVVGAGLLAGCAAPQTGAAPSGVAAADSGDTSEAGALKRAQIRLELAEGYYQRGQLDVALSEANKSLAEKADYVPAYNMRALIYMAMGDNDNADANFRQALKYNPGNTDALHNYGWFLCQQKRYPSSFEMFRKALAQPGYRFASRTYLALGVCEYRAGDLKASEGTLRKGFSLDPANPALATNLAFVLYRMGNAKDALFYIGRVNGGTYASAQSLWIGILAARKAGNTSLADGWTNQLVQHFPDSREAILAQQRRFNDDAIFNNN